LSHIENVRVGQWIVVTNDHAHEKLCDKMKENPWLLLQIPRIRYMGIPGRVIAKSPPYILLDVNGARSVIDSRYISWTKAERRYVNEFSKIDHPNETIKVEESELMVKNKPKCPRCGVEMRQAQPDGEMPTILVCDNCGGEFV
jgi:hypothetical protein